VCDCLQNGRVSIQVHEICILTLKRAECDQMCFGFRSVFPLEAASIGVA
jgi:hypothetical protein